MPNLRRCNRLLARADAVQPISMLVFAVIELYFVRPNHARQDLRIARNEGLNRYLLSRTGCGRSLLVAAHEKPSLRTVELDAVLKVAADRHRHAVRVHGM